MSTSRALRAALLAVVVGLAAIAALVTPASAGSTSAAASSSAVPMSKEAGTLAMRVVINRFTAKGRKVVGRGTAVSVFTDPSGKRVVKRKHFWLRIRERDFQQKQTICQILFLELGELDLTLLGLHAVLHAADPTQPIQLRLTADDAGGILGKLFCQLSQGGGVLSTAQKAVRAAKRLTKSLHGTTIMRASATIYVPNGATGAASLSPQQTEECPILHLILGPLHLELLGLIADLNKIELTLTAIPGTLLGNIFCQLSTPAPLSQPGLAQIRAG